VKLLPSALVACLGVATGGCDIIYYMCDEPPAARLEAPALLSQTGLYDPLASDRVAGDVRAFRPRFELWSDGADKRRWVHLPPGARIDTSDMDAWRFPVGTRLWKEFTRDGVRVETRLLERIGEGDGDWLAVAYLWREDGSDADLALAGVIDARGTGHDVPAAAECQACHGGRASGALGFSAIQLAGGGEGGGGDGDDELLDLDDLVASGWLSEPPAGAIEVPGSATERAALGYLHANCGHCHNQARPAGGASRCYDPDNELDFWLQVDRLQSPEDTPTYQSAVGTVIAPGDPGASGVIGRASTRDRFVQMPPLGTELVDRQAVEILEDWIREMRP